jgi:hypothetical protein
MTNKISDDELAEVRGWCHERKAAKPWYGEDSPKLLAKCDFLIALIDELRAYRRLESTPTPVSVRHENGERNKIINRASTDLESIINGHDPDVSILGNDVWGRLDRMAVEIEQLISPTPVIEITDEMVERAVPHYAEGGCIGLAEYEVKEAIASILHAALNNKA